MSAINRIAHLFDEPEPTMYHICLDLPESIGDVILGKVQDRETAVKTFNLLAQICRTLGRKPPQLVSVNWDGETVIDPSTDTDEGSSDPRDEVLQVVLVDGDKTKLLGEPKDLHSALHLLRLGSKFPIPGRPMLRLATTTDERLDDLHGKAG